MTFAVGEPTIVGVDFDEICKRTEDVCLERHRNCRTVKVGKLTGNSRVFWQHTPIPIT